MTWMLVITHRILGFSIINIERCSSSFKGMFDFFSHDNAILLKRTEMVQPLMVWFSVFRVHIVTWNVGSAMPPDDISGLFSPGVSDGSTDMFIVGWDRLFFVPMSCYMFKHAAGNIWFTFRCQSDTPLKYNAGAGALAWRVGKKISRVVKSCRIIVCWLCVRRCALSLLWCVTSCLSVCPFVRLQEVNCMINKRLKDALFVDQWSELCMDTLGRSGYVLVSDQSGLKVSANF